MQINVFSDTSKQISQQDIQMAEENGIYIP